MKTKLNVTNSVELISSFSFDDNIESGVHSGDEVWTTPMFTSIKIFYYVAWCFKC